MATPAPTPPEPAAVHGEQLKSLWDRARAWDRDHHIWSDVLVVAVLVAFCLAWTPRFRTHRLADVVLQLALVLPLIWRRRAPSTVFAVIALVAFVQWLVTQPLPADVALLVALFTVATHQPPRRGLAAAVVLEAGAVMASVRWGPAGDSPKSVLFLTGMVVAALFVGTTLRTWRAYLASLVERTKRLEFEHDQEVQIAAASERNRIAREMHDIVAHNVSIMVTLADGAAVVGKTDPERAVGVMREVSSTGRLALTDMRRLLGVLRSEDGDGIRAPQPDLAEIRVLIDRVRSTGLDVTFEELGSRFDVPAAVGLTVYRIAQESLTNVLKHADGPSTIEVVLTFDAPFVELAVRDDGSTAQHAVDGHGLHGMRERTAIFDGHLVVGPRQGGGWEVVSRIRIDEVRAPA